MKRVVIIGGGFAGSYIARNLENEFEVVLIDTKDYFEFTPGILRTIVEPRHIKKVQVLHGAYLKRTRIIVGHVTVVSPKEVIVNKEKVPFDYLVISSGSKYSVPIKEQNVVSATRASHLMQYYERLCQSQEVLIVGGGLVGVELAAEIASHYKGKKITIIHAKEKLIERNPEKASKYAEKFLRKKGVEIIFNERVVRKEKEFYKTDKGKKLKADLVFLCTGIVPNFEFLTKHFKKILNEHHQVRVNSSLQVNGWTNIFAAGDINDIAQEKTAQNAKYQAKVVAENIRLLEENNSLENFNAKQTPMVISLGKSHGILVYKNFVWSGLLPGFMKTIVEKKEMMKYK